jgi:hypothetical protein
MTVRQREEPIRSREVLDSARGQPCTLEFEVCNRDPDTTVSCHIPDEIRGGARKADDTSTVHGCAACHAYLDERRWVGVLTREQVLEIVLRAVLRTLRNRVLRKIMPVKLDRQRTFAERPTPSRKPPEQRAPIRSNPEIKSRPTKWASRTMESANNLRRERKSK